MSALSTVASQQRVAEDVLAARRKWRYRGTQRPPFALPVPSGCESVWDYPRPPSICADGRLVRVLAGDAVLADSTRAVRVLETASPPTFYLPPEDVRAELLTPSERRTFCEWKGSAEEFDLALPPRQRGVAWRYPDTFPEFAAIAGYFSFYPAQMQCMVGDELVRPQPGGYYGGWVTSELVGPFKGEAGSEPWW